MKILIVAVLAVLPVSVSAQTVNGTLELVQDLSFSAGSSKDLSAAREDASKPFSAAVTAPPVVRPGNGPQHKPGIKPPAHTPPPGNHNGGHHNGGHNNGGHNNGGHHNNPPIIVHPPSPYSPYCYPGCNDPFHHHYPSYPGYYPSGPSHDTTYPVVSGPMDKTAVIITVVAIAALILLLILV